MNTVQPASSSYADLFIWKTLVTIPSNAPGQQPTSQDLQILGDSFFCLMAFVGSTNYDPIAGEYAVDDIDSGASHLYAPPRIPNNFAVFIKQDGQINLMSAKVPQACICSSGYLAGRQMPFPLLFKPSTTFNFDFFNIAPTLLQQSMAGAAIDLEINFGLYGYNVPAENLEQFCASFPAMQEIAATNQPLWLKNFTKMAIPGLTQ